MKKNLMFLFFLFFNGIFLYSQMPTPVFDVLDYGAIADGKIKNTASIQAAIDACAGTGGSVYIHDGVYLTGMLTLKSNMTFYLEKSATLLGSTDISDYPIQNLPTDNWNKQENGRGLLYSLGARNLKITGGGTINGNGRYAPWVAGSIDELERPIPLWIVQSRQVEISNLDVVDGAMWTIVPFETDSIVIRNVRINSNIVANRDGIDIVDCHHVLIEDCDFYTDDDVICPKSGAERGVSDVIVRNCTIRKSGRASGIKFGTLGYGSFKNMLFEDITIEDVSLAGIALEAVDGADIENVIFRRIKMTNVGTPFFIILGDRGRVPDGGIHKIGSISNVIFEDISASHLKHNIGCPISGFAKDGKTYKLKNIQFNNIDIDFTGGLQTIPGSPPEYVGQYPEVTMWGNLPAYGFYVRHADSISFNNFQIAVSPQDARQWIVCSDTSKVIFENVTNKVVNVANVINSDNYSSDSGFSNSAYLWDGLTNNGSNDSKAIGDVEAWVEFSFDKPIDIYEAKLFEDNSGNQVTDWKVKRWDDTSSQWTDIFPYTNSNTAGWQYVVFDTLSVSKIRLYAKCTSGGYVSIHEFSCYAATQNDFSSIPTIDSDNGSFQLWNLAMDKLILSVPSCPSKYSIFDLSGRNIETKSINVEKSIVNVSSFSAGVYLLKVTTDDQKHVFKFIKS